MKTTRIMIKPVPKGIYKSYNRRRIADAIVSAYSQVSGLRHLSRPPLAVQDSVLSTTATGLGDAVVLSDLQTHAAQHGKERYVWSPAPFFEALSKFFPNYVFPHNRTFFCDGQSIVDRFDCGCGHIIQRYQRMHGLPVADKPQGRLVGCDRTTAFKDRVLLHFDGNPKHVARQQELYHPNARQLTPQARLTLEQFIATNPDLEFVEVGQRPLRLRHTQYLETPSVGDLINAVNSASWFLGIPSGPMHIAAALGLRCIVVINMPRVQSVVLPNLRATHTVEEEWLYPQNVHLHQNGSSGLVPQLSVTSLKAAFAGDVYPFWEDSWLELVHAYE